MQNTLNKIMNWIYRLLSTQFYFLIYSLKGFIIMGFFPSLATVYGLCRRWLLGDFPVIKDYFKEEWSLNKENSSPLGYSMLAIGWIISMNLRIFSSYKGLWQVLMFNLFTLFSITWGISAAALFALYSEFKLPRRENLRLALVFPFAKILHAALLGVLLYCLNYLIFNLLFPLGIFIGVPAIALLSTVICRFSWRKEFKEKL